VRRSALPPRPAILAALAAAAALGAFTPGARLAAQGSTIVQTDAGPCELATQPPPAAARLGAAGQEGELLPSVEIAEPADARLARLKATALYDAPAESWIDPPEIKGDRDIDTTLRVAYAKHTINGKVVNLRSYVLADGTSTIPAPTLRFRDLGPVAGRHLRVKLRNELPCNGGKPGDPTCKPTKCEFHEHEHPDPNNPANFRLNDTNLHVHGLHVSPRPPQDDVLLTVEPGCDYAVDVFIKDHPPGTHWYHPHQHGATALQLASGMAGAIVLEGGVDNLPEVKAAKERVFVFQQISYDPQTGLNEDFKKLDKNWNATKLTLINGQVKPRIVMPRRAVERWRFVNGGLFEVLPIRLAGDAAPGGVPLHVLAVDGITLPRRRPEERVDLAPGNRADVMVQFDRPGIYYLYKSESMRQEGVLDTAQILAEVEVLPETKEMKLPDALPGTPTPIDETLAKPRQPLYFSVRFDDKVKRPRFIINGRDFDPMRVDQTLKLGATEEWTIFNCSDQDHPFHIHVNPFQVSEYTVPDGHGGVRPVRIGDPNQRPWHDTFLIPKGVKVVKDGKEVITPGYFKLLTRYDNYDGRFVLHCHILTHEDQGMMQLIDIVQ
jgi:FtsP/CotA-like multicopper oxidase with cupredoxin domain